MPQKPFAYPKTHSTGHSLCSSYCHKVDDDEQHVVNATREVLHLAEPPHEAEVGSLLYEPKHEIAS
jgi:hypothetical protein